MNFFGISKILMNIGGFNIFLGEKGDRIDKHLHIIKEIFESDPKNKFNIFKEDLGHNLKKLDFIVTCGDMKIIFPDIVNQSYRYIKQSNIPHLIRDVTYIREIPKKTGLDVNNYPRFTWNSIVPTNNNFPYDSTYDRWGELKKKYKIDIKDYDTSGENILFLLQIPTDASLNEITFNNDNYLDFMIRTIDKILVYTDRKIILRGHPLNAHKEKILPHLIYHYENTNRVFRSKNENLIDEFKNTKCVISFNSSATVEALLSGINVINLSKNQPCFSAASNKIEDIDKISSPDRTEFLQKISFLHWENEELKSNEIKKYLSNLLLKNIH